MRRYFNISILLGALLIFKVNASTITPIEINDLINEINNMTNVVDLNNADNINAIGGTVLLDSTSYPLEIVGGFTNITRMSNTLPAYTGNNIIIARPTTGNTVQMVIPLNGVTLTVILRDL